MNVGTRQVGRTETGTVGTFYLRPLAIMRWCTFTYRLDPHLVRYNYNLIWIYRRVEKYIRTREQASRDGYQPSN